MSLIRLCLLKAWLRYRAISGWSEAGEDVTAQLMAIFGLEMQTYQEAHRWWMAALEGADDRLQEIERRAGVFAQRYGGQVQ